MPSVRERIGARCARHGISPLDALFFLCVCAFFFFLPLRTDATATILTMTVLAISAVRRRGAWRVFLDNRVRLPLLAFAVFICVAFIASALNPATLSKFPRVLLWGCCVFSGVALSLCVPHHGGGYFWALFLALAASFAIAAVFYGYDNPAIWHDGRLKLFAMHPSRLGLYASACLFFLLYRAIAASGRERGTALVGALLAFYILFSTNTRGNLLMLPLGLLCLGVSLPGRYVKHLVLAVLLCAVLGGGILWVKSESFVGQRLISAVTNPLEDATFKTRLPIWHVAWESFKTAPAIGHGYQSYLEEHAAYTREHGAMMRERFGGYEAKVKQAHNIILGRLVETGIVGTAAFFLFYCVAIAAAWRGPRSNRWLLAPLVFYLAMSMFDDGLYRINDAFILFVAGTALGGLLQTPEASRSAPVPSRYVA
ncbi:MAG: O-antigen ligase family protein [Deltaproteobacteria bacterium]|nr:O-antigen ligase family protein [Deltaproteobacteria bacterium]